MQQTGPATSISSTKPSTEHGPQNQLTSNTDDDHQSWLMQDLSGTLWEFWTRCVSTGQTCEDDVFYKTSTNLGGTWSAEVQFTVDPSGYTINDSHPSAIHNSRDKMIYVFWAQTSLVWAPTSTCGCAHRTLSPFTTCHCRTLTPGRVAPGGRSG